MRHSHAYAFAIFLIISISCGDKKTSNKETQTSKYTKIDSLRSTYLGLQDSVVHAWNVMIHDDNEKLSTLSRLLDEVEFAGGVDAGLLASLKARITALKEMRYDRESMADSDLIDQYDIASQNLVNEVIVLVQNHPDFDRFPLMNEFIQEISASDGRILFLRIDYDDWAIEYNNFLKENESNLEEIDNTILNIQLSLFQLEE